MRSASMEKRTHHKRTHGEAHPWKPMHTKRMHVHPHAISQPLTERPPPACTPRASPPLALAASRPCRLPQDFHDFHHMRFNCCFGNIGWLDALHGTSKMYYQARAAKKQQREKAQAEWEAQAAAIRQGLAEKQKGE